MKDEDPPNRAVHAEDLASALGRLSERRERDRDVDGIGGGERKGTGRKRSGSGLVVYEPAAHGAEEGLPAVMVEDTSGDGGQVSEGGDAEEEGDGKVFTHTARPPVELME